MLPYATPNQLDTLAVQLNAHIKEIQVSGGVPTKMSQLENDSGYITADALSDYYTRDESDEKYATKAEIPSVANFATVAQLNAVEAKIPTDTVTTTALNAAISDVTDDMANYALKTEIPDVSGFATTSALNAVQESIPTDTVSTQTLTETLSDYALKDDIQRLPVVCTMPFRKVIGYIGDDGKKYSKETVFGWFGVTSIGELKSLIIQKPIYLTYGISLSGNPMYYYIPVQYTAFTANNKLELITDGLDTNNDVLSRYKITITFNLSSEAATEDTEIAVTVANYVELPTLPDDTDSKTYSLRAVNGTLTWVEG